MGAYVGVSLAGLGELLGEEDELGSVLLDALDVELQRLNGLVAPAVIDGDAERARNALV